MKTGVKLSMGNFERNGQANPLVPFEQGQGGTDARKVHAYAATGSVRHLEGILQGTFGERTAQLVKHGRDDPEWVRDLSQPGPSWPTWSRYAMATKTSRPCFRTLQSRRRQPA